MPSPQENTVQDHPTPSDLDPMQPSAATGRAAVRRAGPADAAAVRELTRAAYAKWVPVIGREPRPMTADYDMAVRDHLVAGRLVIVGQGETFELVPRVVADKIAERDAALVVRVNKPATPAVAEDDPYADYQIPDDFTW